MIIAAAFFLAILLLSLGLAALLSPAAEAPKTRGKELPGKAPAGLQPAPKNLAIFLCLALGLATLAVYAQVADHGFVLYDDSEYVLANPHVRAGLTLSGFIWAFTALYDSNWHPLTWLSHMLDFQLFGTDAGAQHLVNMAFHIGGAVLLFLAFARLTRRPWRSALVAGIFALHPLHVESVAWIAERKDVLSGFFGMLTLFLYARYAEAPSARRYAFVVLSFALGLMAKPMLVTLPFVLLLLDFWPLQRFDFFWPPRARGLPLIDGPALRRLLLEKAPLLALAAVAGLLTLLAHERAEQYTARAVLSPGAEIANAAVSYATYIGKAFWPVDLAVLYPYQPPAAWAVLAALALLAALTFIALKEARLRPYLIVGWLWFLGMLVPVSGIALNGMQAMADRYMYLPMIGLSVAVVWGLAELLEKAVGVFGHPRFLRGGAAVLAAVALLLLAAGAYRQAGYWKDSRTLFNHALAVTGDNPRVRNNLGVALELDGNHVEAMQQYRKALALFPAYAEAHDNLGAVMGRLGRFDDAVEQFTAAVKLTEGKDPESQSNLCGVYYKLGRFDEAILHCREALRLKPDHLDARFNLGIALGASGKTAEAETELTRVLAADPDHPGAQAALDLLRRKP